jgi:hypothetical protein
MSEKHVKYQVSNENQLAELIDLINGNYAFAKKVEFANRDLFVSLLQTLDIDQDKFTENYYYIDNVRNLHISESQFKYVWISNLGLVAKDKSTTNKAVNACSNQYLVLSLLMEKAIEVSQSKTVHDVDSYDFGYLSELSPALFHNILFYIEVFCKAYLSINGVDGLHSHKLSLIYEKTVETMKQKHHGNSLFQIRILDPLIRFVDHVNSIPGNFKEHFVKYDDNPDDDTVILFDTGRLIEVKTIFELSHDFIFDYFHMKEETFYLKPGVYERMIKKAKTEDEKDRIKKMYGHLSSK